MTEHKKITSVDSIVFVAVVIANALWVAVKPSEVPDRSTQIQGFLLFGLFIWVFGMLIAPGFIRSRRNRSKSEGKIVFVDAVIFAKSIAWVQLILLTLFAIRV